jgi:hypothetical protein
VSGQFREALAVLRRDAGLLEVPEQFTGDVDLVPLGLRPSPAVAAGAVIDRTPAAPGSGLQTGLRIVDWPRRLGLWSS